MYETTDYGKFSNIEANRDVDHVETLRRSFSARYVPHPIVVNEKLEVVDGQNSLEALKGLGLPVRYTVVPGLGIEDVMAMSQGSRNWRKRDFVKSYAKQGNPAYVAYSEFSARYPELPPSVIETVLRLSGTNDSFDKRAKGQKAYNAIERGIFVIKDLERSCQVADMIMRYKGLGDSLRPIYKQRQFALAIIRASENPKFDNEVLIHKIKLQPTRFVRCINTKDYLSMLERIYNYQRKGGKVCFDT